MDPRLRLFCDDGKEPGCYTLTKPFYHNGYAYAMDSAILARVKSEPFENEGKFPDVEPIMENYPGDTMVCSICGHFRTVYWLPLPDELAKVAFEPSLTLPRRCLGSYVMFGDRRVNDYIYEILKKVQDVKWTGGKSGMFYFRAPGLEGAFLALTEPDD